MHALGRRFDGLRAPQRIGYRAQEPRDGLRGSQRSRRATTPKGNITAESIITVEPTLAAAREWFSILEQPQLASCAGEAFRALVIEESPGLLRRGNSVGKAQVARVAFPRYGDQTVAYRLIIPIVAEGQNLSDYVLVRRGRADVMLTFTRLCMPVSSTMEQRLTALTTRRLRG